MVDFEKRPVTLRSGLKANLCTANSGMFGGLLLVVLGTLLFIDNLDMLPFSVAGAFWPLAVLAYCAIAFVRTGNPFVRVWTVTGIAWGSLLLLSDLHILHIRGAILWPLVLIASGVILLQYRLRWQAQPWRSFTDRVAIGSNTTTRSTAARLEEFAVFSGVKRRLESVSFEGGQLNSVFGSVEVDLRWASIGTPDRQAVLEANVLFGAIELRVPETWRVNLQGNAIFGAYEDKTIPPRPDPGSVIPTLVIRGSSAFGAVVVKN